VPIVPLAAPISRQPAFVELAPTRSEAIVHRIDNLDRRRRLLCPKAEVRAVPTLNEALHGSCVRAKDRPVGDIDNWLSLMFIALSSVELPR
jgi:hypothetical protein